jgi:hypothetical protein
VGWYLAFYSLVCGNGAGLGSKVQGQHGLDIAPSEAVSKWQLKVIPEKCDDRMGYWRKRRRSNLYSTMHLAKKRLSKE